MTITAAAAIGLAAGFWAFDRVREYAANTAFEREYAANVNGGIYQPEYGRIGRIEPIWHTIDGKYVIHIKYQGQPNYCFPDHK